jgi:putative ABC transport system substrate-binding protein
LLPVSAANADELRPIVGFISNGSRLAYAPFAESFRQGLRQVGYVDGRNVTVRVGWGEGDITTTERLIEESVALPVDVLITSGGDPAAKAAKAKTKDIPIVATCGSDPVETGLVASIKHPGGNLTCVSVFSVQLVAKRLQLAKEIIGNSGLIAILINPNNPNAEIDAREMAEAGKELSQPVVQLNASNEAECEAAFARLVNQSVKALVVSSDPYFNNLVDKLVALAQQYAIPTIFPRREFSVAGGLVSYGSSLSEAYRQLGVYAGRVLKGDKPADLPVVLPTRFDLIINLKTAKSLNVEMPTGILLSADEILE